MGRPTDLTPRVQREICERLEKGLSLADAAQLSGVGASTVYQWQAKGREGIEPYAEFAEAVARARARAKEILIDQVQMYAQADQPQSWRSALELYKELMGSSRAAEMERAREEVTGEILDRLRARLDPPTFARVVDALCDEGGGEVPPAGYRRIV